LAIAATSVEAYRDNSMEDFIVYRGMRHSCLSVDVALFGDGVVDAVIGPMSYARYGLDYPAYLIVATWGVVLDRNLLED
jgi:hypothetical protein